MCRQVYEALNNDFCWRVREIHQEKGITILELAANSGLQYSQINRIELGKVNTFIYSTWMIAKALGVELRDLF